MRQVPPELYGIPIKDIARICEVSVKTATRWKSGQSVPPRAARMILSGDLGAFDPAWAGWVIRRGILCSPENWMATPGDVRATQLVQAQLAAHRHENLKLRIELENALANQYEEQPLPDQWEIVLAQ